MAQLSKNTPCAVQNPARLGRTAKAATSSPRNPTGSDAILLAEEFNDCDVTAKTASIHKPAAARTDHRSELRPIVTGMLARGTEVFTVRAGLT
jgi:hypothetical protein